MLTREQMAKQIVDWEARRDGKGHLKVYKLPSNDGGGTFEVAGINERYDGTAARRLRRVIEAGKFDEAEAYAIDYIANYTDAVKGWVSTPAIEFFLRDCCFNRGPRGAAKILQLALHVKADGVIGPITRAAITSARLQPLVFLDRLRLARENYENIVAPGRPNLRKGLVNRWNNALAASQGYLAAA